MADTSTLTPKQEAFAQAVAQGMNQSDAYRSCFKVRKGTKPDSIHQSACRVMSNVKVASRIQELRAPAVKAVAITLEEHLRELADLRDKAAGDGKWAAAVSAESARGRASGLYTEKVEHSGIIGTASVDVTPEQEAMLRKVLTEKYGPS